MKMRIKRIGEHGLPIPKMATEGAAGFDLQAVENKIIHEKSMVSISCGFAIEIPRGCVGIVFPRSGLAFNHGIQLFNIGVIDSDYRGEVRVLLYNADDEDYCIEKGDRIAQLVILPMPIIKPVEVDDLDETERGDRGFGSTGV